MTVGGRCVGIVLNGEIRRGEAPTAIQRLSDAAERCATRTVVIGKMPGGSVYDALAIGTALRAADYATVALAGSQCHSACGLVYLGGVHRYWQDRARFMIHRPVIYDSFPSLTAEIAAYEDLKERLIRYATDMGGNPDYVEAMYAVPSGQVAEVTSAQRTAWSLSTTGGLPF